MLPFYGSLLQHIQLNQALTARVRFEYEQAAERERALARRRLALAEAWQLSQELATEAKIRPHQAFISLELLFFDLTRLEVTPDGFEETTEKEKAALLGRKLANIQREVMATITPAQLDTCRRYLQILSDFNFTAQASAAISGYAQWQAARKTLSVTRARQLRLSRLQWAAAIAILLTGYLSFRAYIAAVGIDSAFDRLIFWLLGGALVMLAVFGWLEWRKPKNIPLLCMEADRLAAECRVEDILFWNAIRASFGSHADSAALAARLEDLRGALIDLEEKLSAANSRFL